MVEIQIVLKKKMSTTTNTKSKENKKSSCDEEVKYVLKEYSHRRCTSSKSRRYCVAVNGSLLNNYLINHRQSSTDPKRFNPRKKYNICRTLHSTISNATNKGTAAAAEEESTPQLICPIAIGGGVQNPARRRQTRVTLQEPPMPINDEANRSQRLFLRNRIPASDPRLKGIKKVVVEVGSERDEIDTTTLRANKNAVFIEEVLGHYYRVPYRKMTMRGRRDRMSSIAKVVLGACVDRKEYKKNSDEYLVNNINVAIDVINLLDGVKEVIQKKMKMNFHSLSDVAVVPIANDRDGRILELDEEKNNHVLAKALLGEMTVKGYERIKRKIGRFTNLPSAYKLGKLRPKVVAMDIQCLEHFDSSTSTSSENPCDVLDMNEMNRIPDEYELELVMRQLSQSREKDLVGAKIDGGYVKYVELLKAHHEDHGRTVDVEKDNVVVLDSIDGAEHIKSKTQITSVISFSSSFLCGSWINDHTITAGASRSILTWQQLRGKETIYSMKPAVESYFKDKKVLRESGEHRNSWFYDLHDGKMLYLLTQHAQWNRKNNPFLLCNCSRGAGVRNNNNHVCTWLTHEEQIEKYDRSERRWRKKRNEPIPPSGKEYTVKDHMDWVDSSNVGVSHFGIHPDLLPCNELRFDTFHMKCAVTQKLMGFLRRFMMNQATDVIESFTSDILGSFWKDFHLYVWNNKKNFSSFQGAELALFVANTNTITQWFEETFESTNEVEDIKTALQLWVELFKFLGTTYVEDKEKYKVDMKNFEKNVKKFYDCGSRTFLSSKQGVSDGDEETFYTHVLRFYIPIIAIMTFERHEVGVGIFNMQGFERRNKESKNIMSNHSNNKGNILIPNVKKLWDAFERKDDEV